MNKKNGRKMAQFGLALLLATMSCQLMPSKAVEPGSLQEAIQRGNIRFEGNGNLTYAGCMDPAVEVTLTIDAQATEFEGQKYSSLINPVTVTALTDGIFLSLPDCGKRNQDEKNNWPARGLYYPADEEIVFYGCSMKDGKAEGIAKLTGTGTDLYFEGEYRCLSADGNVVYEIAFSVFRVDQ